ncbi:MotA/TolQ/ExbB proton channel family protein [bacterium]|jgi:biopolymer transport protein ExbB|nr:MotA/TolQ/ExbB proton channel family protein [bacterium]
MNFLELLVRGGTTMVFLVLCSVVSVGVIIERLWFLRKDRVIPKRIVDIFDNIDNIAEHPEDVIEKCEKVSSPLSNVLKTGLLNRGLSKADNVEAIKLAGRTEMKLLEKHLTLLEVIGVISPLLGLLGTVIGMVEIFSVISHMGVGQAAALSAGISKALITTVVGLIIAIPSIVAYGYFDRKVDALVLDMEKHSAQMIHSLYH